MDDTQELLHYYLDELAYLRRMGREFATLYPEVARHLEFEDGVSRDPHVERLTEAFAFLTARLQRRLDLDVPEISEGLLGVLAPNLVTPVPPMAIARFEVDPAQAKSTAGYVVPRHTPLFAQRGGSICRFRTVYPVELWPLEIVDIDLHRRSAYKGLDAFPQVESVLRIQIVARDCTFLELDLKRLRFFVHGDSTLVGDLYEFAGHGLDRVALVADEDRDAVFLPPDALRLVGFGPDEDVIPSVPNAPAGYRLLQEYLHVPRKFHFFDVHYLDRCPAEKRMSVLLLASRPPHFRSRIRKDSILLGCTPIQNLFSKTSEPIRVDQRLAEYRLIPDQRRETATEIHSIQSVSASPDPESPALVVEPFFSARHGATHASTFWHARRKPTGLANLPGTDVWVSFLDQGFRVAMPPSQVLYAQTLCTNRDKAPDLRDGSGLQIEMTMPLKGISLVTAPTETAYPALGGAALWKLVSNLTLSHLSLSSEKIALDALKEMLRLYDFTNSPTNRRQIDGIIDLSTAPAVRRVGKDPWRGFCRGTEITLLVDEARFVGGSAFLLASVLHRFFALYTQVNSFVELVLKSEQRQEPRRDWPPLAGSQALV